jgi:hypothetical protein
MNLGGKVMKKILFLVVSVVLASDAFAGEKFKGHFSDMPGFQAVVLSINEPSGLKARVNKVTIETSEGTRELEYSKFGIGPDYLTQSGRAGESVYLIYDLAVRDIKSAEIFITDENSNKHKLNWPGPNRPVADRKFWAVSAALIGSTIYDIETTFYTLDRCSNCVEGNPITRPFVERGRPATYAFAMSVTAAQIFLSYKLKQMDSKLWWIFPGISIGVHGFAGTHNLSLTWNTSF